MGWGKDKEGSEIAVCTPLNPYQPPHLMINAFWSWQVSSIRFV